MKKNIIVVALVIAILTIMGTAYAADNMSHDGSNAMVSTDTPRENVLKKARSYISRNFKLVGFVTNDYGDHVLFYEVEDWTIMMINDKFLWAVPYTNGKLSLKGDNVIHFEDEDWDFSNYMNGQYSCESEIITLYWSEWRYNE